METRKKAPAEAPNVTVVIPTHNRAHLVGRAIQSVLQQTYEDFELIVVDDASTDETEEVVAGFEDLRIKYIQHKDNKGAAAARNTGIEVSTGHYIGFLDSDDRWLPEKLQEQLRVFREGPPDLGVVYTGIEMRDLASGEVLRTQLPRHRGRILRRLLRENVIVGSASTVLIRRRFLEESGLFDEALPARQDADLWIRLAKLCCFDYVNRVLAAIYVHAERITDNPQARIEGSKLVFEKIKDDLEQDRWLLAEGHHFVARELCKAGQMREARQYMLKAIMARPFGIKYYGALLSSLLGRSFFARVQNVWLGLRSLPGSWRRTDG